MVGPCTKYITTYYYALCTKINEAVLCVYIENPKSKFMLMK